jgi:uncharacterized membrane protein
MTLFLPAFALVWWMHRISTRQLSPRRSRALLIVRGLLLAVILVAIAGPAIDTTTDEQAVVFVIDHSQSQGKVGMAASRKRVKQLIDSLPAGTKVGIVSAGASSRVLQMPGEEIEIPEVDEELLAEDGGQTDLASAVSLSTGLFPSGTARRIVLVGDAQETRGDLESAARRAAQLGVTIDVVPIAGQRRPDVRISKLVPNKSRTHEGASLELRADIESSMDGEGQLRLFENGVEVESRKIKLKIGERITEVFRRTPEERNLYTYRMRLEGFEGDSIPDNDVAMTLVDVRGRPLLLYIEGEQDEAHYLADAMESEGIRLHLRSPRAFPRTLQELAGYDGVIVSDVPAHQFTDESMSLIRDYVELLGGGFIMIGGENSFGVGGYYRTPIEDILPVRMKSPDREEKYATALCLVIDRSGSMSGQKIELCKSAAQATVELMTKKDYISVVSFDSSARLIVPITRVSSKSTITSQISTLSSGGGTNIHPGMVAGQAELRKVKAKVKHMIVLTDGHSSGSGYQQLAAAMRGEGITISTVAVGQSAAGQLLQTIATAGGGKFYQTTDPSNIPKIFTQDAMTHMGRLIREESFAPKQVEQHPMLKGVSASQAPALLGYVTTSRKATAQVPLVTHRGDPLLAHWQYGLGKVTAFTSDCKSRWGALWISTWSGYGQFWAQVLRETTRRPQSRHMDVRVEQVGELALIKVDLMQDAAHFRNDADVEADVYFVAAGSVGSSMQALTKLQLSQTGPGRYEANFSPEEPGVYLVRTRCGADVVSAGLVHNTSVETATGQVDQQLIESVTRITGGEIISADSTTLPTTKESHSHFIELTPWLLRIFLVLFVMDVAIRRWDNLLSIATVFRRDR